MKVSSPPLAVFFLFLPFIFSGLQGMVFGLRSGEDLAGLYSLRTTLGIRSRQWPRKADPCTGWTGVRCESGRVVSLELSDLRRTRLGKLNPQFAVEGLQRLTHLSILNTTRFAIPGPIPEWFGSRLPNSVTVLDLSFSSITGVIPESLGNLTALGKLSLSGNFLTGRIPVSFGQLRNLTSLDLSGNRLVGSVPGSLGDLALLTTLNLGRNSLSGPVPEDLRNIRSLQVLDLGNNSFSDALPDILFMGFPSLRLLTLSHNNFSGSLPDSLWALSELLFVDVSHNNFTGALPEVVVNFNVSDAVFNFSNNFYYGPLPSEFEKAFQGIKFLDISDNYFEGVVILYKGRNGSVELNCFRNVMNQRSLVACTEFYANRQLRFDGMLPPNMNQTGASVNSGRKSKRQLVYIIVGVFGGLLLAVVSLLLLLYLRKCRSSMRRQKERTMNDATPNAVHSGQRAPVSRFSLNLSAVGDSFTHDQLVRATSNFSKTNFMKHGHSGDLYHGTLETGAPVVVKRIDVRMFNTEPYIVELDFFTRASHTRLVSLLGHCLENDNEKLLVYKYMPNGDLSSALHRKLGDEERLKSLDWITRLKIAIGLAEALCYLHHECTPPLVHRDVQASSILLDDKYEVRLGSMSDVCSQDNDNHQNVLTRFLRFSQSSEQGTSGSPSATCAYDVYCLGKVLLELVTGRLGISGSSDAPINVWLEQTLTSISIYDKELLLKILDPSLVVDEDLMEEVWAMAIVAKSCVNPRPLKRPQVKYVLKALENPLKVVRDENTSNSARLRATSSRGSWNAALFGSWRSSSDIASFSGPHREMTDPKYPGTVGSHRSVGEQSFNHKRPSKEIFPEPLGGSEY